MQNFFDILAAMKSLDPKPGRQPEATKMQHNCRGRKGSDCQIHPSRKERRAKRKAERQRRR